MQLEVSADIVEGRLWEKWWGWGERDKIEVQRENQDLPTLPLPLSTNNFPGHSAEKISREW
jgi:hypothetical protein